MDKETAKQKIKELVEKYEQVVKSGQLKKYTEQETKKDFIEPLFESLGWNIREKKEVSAEENISNDRVDYGFYINERPKFYLEAKPLKADLHKEDYAKQAIRYSWNKGVSWAVLTDFESMKIFNAQAISQYLADKMFFEISYAEYIERFDQLWLLSKESFEKDLIDKEAEKVGKKMQKVSVSSILYKDLNECRDILIKDLGACNPNIDKDSLDEGIQKLLDRLIFLRVAEDRDIEKDTLKSLMRQIKGKGIAYESMVSKFREMNSIYNSNLFSEHPFEKWEDFGGATEKVIKKLYGKEGYYEYDFKIMPADVLGTVYEHYLGHRLSQSKKGITVDKDAKKRKEQGIYYTPDFIVDYIVKNALKPILDKCKGLSDLKKIKVLDPACGSGSFLIKALNVIYDKYKEFNNTSDESTVKMTILMENIYGVDLDGQAVEIAQLNLLINALYRREKFPHLDHIKNGNSLISGTDEELQKYFGKNFRDKKPFNWQEEFPEVFLASPKQSDGGKQGGFDVIIGNPPYIFARGGNFDEDEKKYYSDNFKLLQYQLNTFLLFIEKGINLLKEKGFFGFIIPNNWLTINSFSKLREYLLKNTADLKIINAIDTIFGQASVDTCILLFKKDRPTKVELGELKDGNLISLNLFEPEKLYENEYVINISKSKSKDNKILEKLNFSVSLSDIVTVSTGLKAYQIGKGKPTQTEEIKKARKFHANKKIDKTYIPYLDGVDVKRYKLDWSGEYLSYGKWLAEPRKSVPFDGLRILIRQIPSPLPYCINGVYVEKEYLNDINSMVVFKPVKDYNLKYILGVINSRLISYWFANAFDKFQRKIFPQFKVNELAKFPIYQADKEQQKRIIILVDKMLDLNKELQKTEENSNKWNSIKEEIEKTDKKIDEEVYKLYNLTKEEIKIVENK